MSTYTLSADNYTSADAFEREKQALFARTWHFAGHRSALKNPGDYFAFEIADQPFFCVLDRTNTIRAYFNVCQHRAHVLLEGTGNCKVVVCPYHAWTYELTGELRGGPNLIAADFDKSSVRLREVKVEDFLGFIFINMDPQAAPMDEWYPRVREELSEFVPHVAELEPLTWVSVNEVCNWKVSTENYSECYHCARNHPAFASGVIKPETYDIQPQGYCLRHTTESQNLDDMSYPIDLESNQRAGEYSSWFLWPLFSFQVYPGNVLNTYHWRPRSQNKVDVIRGWYTVGGEESDVIRGLARQDRETTVAEDIQLVESVQKGLESLGYDSGPLMIDANGGVQSEHSIAAMQAWTREFLN